jgi:hypothetical protein
MALQPDIMEGLGWVIGPKLRGSDPLSWESGVGAGGLLELKTCQWGKSGTVFSGLIHMHTKERRGSHRIKLVTLENQNVRPYER